MRCFFLPKDHDGIVLKGNEFLLYALGRARCCEWEMSHRSVNVVNSGGAKRSRPGSVVTGSGWTDLQGPFVLFRNSVAAESDPRSTSAKET